MPREEKIQKIYDGQSNKESKIALACKEFLDFYKRYRHGDFDVIIGLQHLDQLEGKIYKLMRK